MVFSVVLIDDTVSEIFAMATGCPQNSFSYTSVDSAIQSYHSPLYQRTSLKKKKKNLDIVYFYSIVMFLQFIPSTFPVITIMTKFKHFNGNWELVDHDKNCEDIVRL